MRQVTSHLLWRFLVGKLWPALGLAFLLPLGHFFIQFADTHQPWSDNALRVWLTSGPLVPLLACSILLGGLHTRRQWFSLSALGYSHHVIAGHVAALGLVLALVLGALTLFVPEPELTFVVVKVAGKLPDGSWLVPLGDELWRVDVDSLRFEPAETPFVPSAQPSPWGAKIQWFWFHALSLVPALPLIAGHPVRRPPSGLKMMSLWCLFSGIYLIGDASSMILVQAQLLAPWQGALSVSFGLILLSVLWGFANVIRGIPRA